MAVPPFETFMLPVLRIAAAGETTIRECTAAISKELGMSEADVTELLPTGKNTRFANRVHWAKTYLVQAGLLEMTGRGRFRATERGRAVLAQRPSHIDKGFLSQFPEFQAFKMRRKQPTEETAPSPDVSETPEELIEQAYEEITDELRANLLAKIVSSSPAFFEKIIVDLLIAMGYGGSKAEAGQRVGKSGDGGIDGIINEDPLGLDVVYLQAKRYSTDNLVSADQLRGFSGSLLQRGASKGVFVTTSRFSDPARDFVRGIPQQRIVLIDGEELTRLLVKHGVGVRTERAIEIKRLDLDYFDEDVAP